MWNVSFRFCIAFQGTGWGDATVEYLTSWRMQKAAALLQKGEWKMVDVARSVGYDSDAAFSKAFKRVVSVTPRDFRRRSQGCVGKGAAPGEPPAVSQCQAALKSRNMGRRTLLWHSNPRI
jgi:AraC-like DNA-binding protein